MADQAEPGLTKRQRKEAARRELRARIVARVAPGCPTPWKPAYDRSDERELSLQASRVPLGGGSYDCICGFSHNTSQAVR